MRLQPHDADHEEFVEVVGGDRQEADAFQHGVPRVALPSSTLRLKASQLSSRLKKRGSRAGCGSLAGKAAAAGTSAGWSISLARREGMRSILPTACRYS